MNTEITEPAAAGAAAMSMIPVDRIRIVEGHNAYDLVAGERRLTAARQLGLAEVPCLVRRGLDARQLVAAMLVENLQREDLAPLEEASGIRRLVELEMSQREIAAQLGCSQSHVSKRLALLELSDPIRAAIGSDDAGGITIVEALELTKLSAHPQLQDEAFVRGRHGHYGGVTACVRMALAELGRQEAKAAARAELQRAGVKILKEQDYYSWYSSAAKPLKGQGPGSDYEAIGVTVKQHQGEPCHAAAIDRDGTVTYVCREPFRHAAADPKMAAKVEAAKSEQARQREENKLRQEAARGRHEAMGRVLAAANTSHLTTAARQILKAGRVSEAKIACELLGLEAPKSRYGMPSYCETLADYAAKSMAAAIRALVALGLATAEEHVASQWGGPTDLTKRHLEQLAAAGYEPNDSDRKHLEGRPERDDDEESPMCRGCGCTDEEPCHGGCEWVEDPEGEGDLCSRCLDADKTPDVVEAEAGGLAG
jgi:ParB/RepB/Spo0J family partition protein